VFVSNISPSASEKTVTDFFSFCGKINSLSLRTLDNGVKEAIVEFGSDAAAKTALLLTNALIVDRPITVMPYQLGQEQKSEEPSSPHVTHENNLTGDQIENKTYAVPDQERTQTSVIASLLAAGYNLGTDAIQKAREYDEQHAITRTLKEKTDALKVKAQQLDSEYKISETASAWTSAATQFFGDLNTMYGISDKANALKQSGSNWAKQVGESEPVTKAAETLTTAKTVVAEKATELKQEASRLMEPVAAAVTAGTEVVSSSVREVASATTRYISERTPQTTSSPVDESATSGPHPDAAQ